MDKTRRAFLKAAAATACHTVISPLAGLAAASEFSPESKHVKEAYFYKKMGNGTVQCQTCPHACLIVPDGRGKCRTKVNISGKLYSISYENPKMSQYIPQQTQLNFH